MGMSSHTHPSALAESASSTRRCLKLAEQALGRAAFCTLAELCLRSFEALQHQNLGTLHPAQPLSLAWILMNGDTTMDFPLNHWTCSGVELYGGLDGSEYGLDAKRLVAVATKGETT